MFLSVHRHCTSGTRFIWTKVNAMYMLHIQPIFLAKPLLLNHIQSGCNAVFISVVVISTHSPCCQEIPINQYQKAVITDYTNTGRVEELM